MKLHLGCGKEHKKGWINCDISKEVNPDKIIDLEKKLPFKDNSIKEIYSRHTFEHVEKLMELMNEIYRISKNEAKIKIIVPYFAHPGAFQDPTHKRFFTLRTFDYFDSKNSYSYYSNARFKVINKKLIFFVLRPKISKILDYFINKNQILYERFFSRIFPSEELIIEMVVKK